MDQDEAPGRARRWWLPPWAAVLLASCLSSASFLPGHQPDVQVMPGREKPQRLGAWGVRTAPSSPLPRAPSHPDPRAPSLVWACVRGAPWRKSVEGALMLRTGSADRGDCEPRAAGRWARGMHTRACGPLLTQGVHWGNSLLLFPPPQLWRAHLTQTQSQPSQAPQALAQISATIRAPSRRHRFSGRVGG